MVLGVFPEMREVLPTEAGKVRVCGTCLEKLLSKVEVQVYELVVASAHCVYVLICV